MKLIEKRWLDIVAGGVCECMCKATSDGFEFYIGDREGAEICRRSCERRKDIELVYKNCEDIIVIMYPLYTGDVFSGA
jgi:hypothetical protein